eukprot:8638146-Heterocapsa_arctica.AAC.1
MVSSPHRRSRQGDETNDHWEDRVAWSAGAQLVFEQIDKRSNDVQTRFVVQIGRLLIQVFANVCVIIVAKVFHVGRYEIVAREIQCVIVQ